MKGLTLGKYEGAGNDFLVLVDPPADLEGAPELARALCDRHHGVGADGLLLVGRGESDDSLAMLLYNADGSEAETSGNGLRCAILAARHAGLVRRDRVDVETKAGTAHGEIGAATGSGSAQLRVDMGMVEVLPAPSSPLAGARAFFVQVGYPHLVLIADAFPGVDLAEVGPGLSRARTLGQNVELITPRKEVDELDLEVFERGVGITVACGTGSCAGAAAARWSGAVGDRVVVHNPGGPLLVELSGELAHPRAFLSGPVRRIATVVVELEDLVGVEAAWRA